MSKMSNIITCPHCLKSFDKSELGVAKDRKMMAVLVEEGFGLREVGRRFDEHPETVKYWHKKYLEENKPTPDGEPLDRVLKREEWQQALDKITELNKQARTEKEWENLKSDD